MSGPAWSDSAKYTVAVDFDGVLHSYTSPWEAGHIIPDPPVEGAIEWLNKTCERFTVVIFTTRGGYPEGRQAVLEWLLKHGMSAQHYKIEITNIKPPALIYIDDRAYRFDGTNFPEPDEIHKLRPWNKRPMGLKDT